MERPDAGVKHRVLRTTVEVDPRRLAGEGIGPRGPALFLRIFLVIEQHDLVGPDQVERESCLFVEQVGIEMLGPQHRHPMLLVHALGMDAGRGLGLLVNLLRQPPPGHQTAITLDEVIAEIGSKAETDRRSHHVTQLPPNGTPDIHRRRESRTRVGVNGEGAE